MRQPLQQGRSGGFRQVDERRALRPSLDPLGIGEPHLGAAPSRHRRGLLSGRMSPLDLPSVHQRTRQVRQQPRFVLQPDMTPSCMGQRFGERCRRRLVFAAQRLRDGGIAAPVDQQVGVAALFGEGRDGVAVTAGDIGIALAPGDVDLGRVCEQAMQHIHGRLVRRDQRVEQRPRLVGARHHGEDLRPHAPDPHADVEAQRLLVDFVDLVQAGHRLVVGGQRARQIPGMPLRMTQDGHEHGLEAGVARLVQLLQQVGDGGDILRRRAAGRERASVREGHQHGAALVVELAGDRQRLGVVGVDLGGGQAFAPGEGNDLAACQGQRQARLPFEPQVGEQPPGMLPRLQRLGRVARAVPGRGFHVAGRGLHQIAGLLPMVGEEAEARAVRVRRRLFEVRSHRGVQRTPALGQQRAVGDVVHHRVTKGEHARRADLLVHQSGQREPMHDVRQACPRRAEQARQQRRLELPPDHRRGLQHRLFRVGPGVDARGDDRLHRVGHQARIGAWTAGRRRARP